MVATESQTSPASGRRQAAKHMKALSHPARAEILQRIAASKDGQMSPNELAVPLPLSLGAVSYHVSLLAEQGYLELVEEKQRRGAIEHYYALAEDGRHLLEILETVLSML